MPITTPPTAANTSHTDANQQFSIIGVAGTLGTADTAGTSPTIPFGANPATGAQYVELISGTLNVGTVTSTLALNSGTLSTLGTIGSVQTIGTLNAGTVALISYGTVGTISSATSLTLGTMPGAGGVALSIVTAALTGTIQFEATVDNANWFPIAAMNPGLAGNNFVTSYTLGAGTTIWQLAVAGFNAFRTRMSDYTSGSAKIAIQAAQAGPQIERYNQYGIIDANVAGNGGIYLQQEGAPNYALKTGMTTGTVSVNGSYTFSNFSAAGTTTIKSSPGYLHAFVINQKSVGGVGTLYNSVGTSTATIAAIDTTLSTTAFTYNVAFGSLTFAWAGNTGGNVTIAWT